MLRAACCVLRAACCVLRACVGRLVVGAPVSDDRATRREAIERRFQRLTVGGELRQADAVVVGEDQRDTAKEICVLSNQHRLLGEDTRHRALR